MNSSIPHHPLSTEIRPLTYTRDDLIAGCQFIDISPSPPNMNRIRRAMNIFNAGAVHLIQNGKGNHQIYAVQSESDSAHFYTVQGEDMASLICECPDTLNGFECKHIFAVRYFDEQRREQAMIADYEACEANRGCAEDLGNGNRAAHLAESNGIYQTAKARFNETTTRSAARPDSLTRRNGTLIAAKFYGQYDKRMVRQWWSDSIRELFPDATIHKTTVCPRWYTVRCYFSL